MTKVFYEEIPVGFTSTAGPYTVSEEEILEFGQRWDPQPFHTDPEAAKASVFGGLVAPGCLVFSIRSWLVNNLEASPDYLAGLGLENMDLPNPVRAGDQLFLQLECTDRRDSKSRPNAGLVFLQNTMTNQNGDIVLTMIAKTLVKKQENST